MGKPSNPNGANQYLLDPRQKKCWEGYVNPTSPTFANAKQSAIAAGYEEEYANQITVAEWFVGKVRRMNLLGKAENVLEEMLDMPVTVLDHDAGSKSNFDFDGAEPLYEMAKNAARNAGKVSVSFLQRTLTIGYSRASRLMDLLEEHQVVGAASGSRPREVLDEDQEIPYEPETSESDDGVEKEVYVVTEPALVKIKQDTAKFVAERLGKGDGYSTRTEVTGADGGAIEHNVEQRKAIDAALDDLIPG